MSITNSSSARRAGFKINDAAILDAAGIAMTKIGTRTLHLALPVSAWTLNGTSVAITSDGIFPVITLPDANTGNLYTSLICPDEFVAGTDFILDIFWKGTPTSGAVKFSVSLACRTVGGSTALENTQTVTTTINSTSGKLNKSSVTFAGSLFNAEECIGILISRDPADAADTLGADISFVGATLKFTGRG